MEKMTTMDRFKVYILNADPNYGTEKMPKDKNHNRKSDNVAK